MKPILGKWQYVFKFGENRMYIKDHYFLVFGIFKLKKLPPPGVFITKRYYDGFLVECDITIPQIKRLNSETKDYKKRK